jgi:hypothetical protein
MPEARYSNAFVQNTSIAFGDRVKTTFGTLLSEYHVREYWDLRTSASHAGARRAYVVSLKQKISISNSDANSFAKLNPVTSYSGYPVLVVQQVQASSQVNGLNYYLEDYSPKTLNAAVTTSGNASTDSTDANSVQHSAGSSTSVTNSYEISDSVGFFGDDLTGSVSYSSSHSTTNTDESSTTAGRTSSQAVQAGTGSSMSIKDWASYAFLDANRQQPGWVWGQEYPWDVIDFRNVKSTSEFGVALPPYVAKRLYDGATVYPPSDISQFGLNFTASARWIFYVDGQAGSTDETVAFAHSVTYWEGSHDASGATIAMIASNQQIETVQLNLPLLALDPITQAGARNGAVIGFVKSEFIAPPAAPPTPFRLKSGSNNMYVSGSGFGALDNENSVLTAKDATTAAPASLTIQFKMTSENLELSLYFKHWKLSAAGCVLTVLVNEPDPTKPVSPIVRHVDARDAASGTDNITAITLRKKDYTSVEFYDYLVMGLNTIIVKITPEEGQPSCAYAIRALAIS